MIKISKADYNKIRLYAESKLPKEACGLIAGEILGECREIKKVYLLTNADNSSRHFSLDIREQLAAVRDMRKNGLVPLGNWHSHPETPSMPSEEDNRLAYDEGASYLILSLMDKENPILNSFIIKDNNVKKEELIIY